MERLALATGIVVVVALAALIVQRRRPAPPTQARYAIPAQLDRADFDRPDAPWLVVVFSSATCDSCAEALAKAAVVAGPSVAVQDVEVGGRKDLHDRYGVEAVPTIVVADEHGVVRASFLGPPSATDLWAAVADAREPG